MNLAPRPSMRPALFAAALGLGLTAVLMAGPISPPAGPVTSSGKTLTEVEPRTAINATNTPSSASAKFTITQPGSYYLTSNVYPSAGQHGIAVTCGMVTIDLNGYTIAGGTSGVASTGTGDDLVVKNGFINSPTLHGVDFGAADRARIENVVVDTPAGVGITAGNSAIVAKCQVRGGTNGISVNDNGVVADCAVANATGNGFRAGSSCVVTGCTAEVCGGNGFMLTGTANRLSGCAANQCTGRGIDMGNWSSVEDCVCFSNSGMGIAISTGGTVRHCVVEWGNAQGIVAFGGCTIVENQIRYGPSGLAAIWLQGTQNRCEGNDCTANGYGVYTTSTSNVIIKNHAYSNVTKNYHIGPGNIVGVIVVSPTNAVLISGNSGGGMGTTDPNANFAF